MNDVVTVEEIRRACGLHARSVLRWLSRLCMVPVGMRGKLHLYAPDTIPTIQAGMLRAEMARKEAIRAARQRPAIITAAEARRRAGRGAN
jgi:hypothetical protein